MDAECILSSNDSLVALGGETRNAASLGQPKGKNKPEMTKDGPS